MHRNGINLDARNRLIIFVIVIQTHIHTQTYTDTHIYIFLCMCYYIFHIQNIIKIYIRLTLIGTLSSQY